QSDDTETMSNALESLGLLFHTDWPRSEITEIHDERLLILRANTNINTKDSGTTMRFLTALVALGHGRFRLAVSFRMRERPIELWLAARRRLGVNAVSELGNGCPPVIVDANGLGGGGVRIRGDTSSQFLSGLMMASTQAQSNVEIAID